MTPGQFYEITLNLCHRYQASMTSGFRTVKYNKIKGGHQNSRHPLGLAFDLVMDDWSQGPAMKKDFNRVGLVCVLEDKGTKNQHYHIQTR